MPRQPLPASTPRAARPQRTDPSAEEGRGAPHAHRHSSRPRRPLSVPTPPPRRKPFPEPPDLTGVATGEQWSEAERRQQPDGRRPCTPSRAHATLSPQRGRATAPPPPPHARETPLAARARRGGDRACPARGRGPGPFGASARSPAEVTAQPPAWAACDSARGCWRRPSEKQNRPRPREGAIRVLPPPCAPGPAVALAVLHHARSRRFLLRSAASAPGRAAPKSGCSGARWSPGRERRQHPESQQLALLSLGTVVRGCTYTTSGLKKKEKRRDLSWKRDPRAASHRNRNSSPAASGTGGPLQSGGSSVPRLQRQRLQTLEKPHTKQNVTLETESVVINSSRPPSLEKNKESNALSFKKMLAIWVIDSADVKIRPGQTVVN